MKHYSQRYRILSTAVFLFILLPLSAQVGESRKRLAIGINGGANLSSISFNPTIKQNSQTGINGGLTIRYTCEKYFSTLCAVQMEFNYSQRGWNENIDDETGNTYNRVINYLEIPFLAHLAWGKENRGIQFFLNAGPQANLYLSDKENYGGQEPWDTSKRPNGVVEQYKKPIENNFDYGISAGLGLELNTRIGHFLMEGRYYYGLGDIFSATKKDRFSRSANSSIIIKAAYLIDITK